MQYSVLVPVYNEEGSVQPLYSALRKVMAALGQSYEIIFIDDASTDQTVPFLLKAATPDASLKIIRLAKHQGKSNALQAAFDRAAGQIIIAIDGDLQDDPEDIPLLLEKMKDGYDVVYGWRFSRQDPWTKKFPSYVANRIRRLITSENIHDVGCALRVMKREVMENLYITKGMHRFLAALARKLGYRIGEVKVRHYHRQFGKTKYGFWDRLWEGGIDLFCFLTADVKKMKNQKRCYLVKEVLVP